MNPEDHYLALNRQAWNNKVPFHVHSDFYDMARFLAGQTSLKPIELALLGDLKGLSLLHLQCHFGQDSISLARMGAAVTGMDLSDRAIAQAQELAVQTDSNATFICSDVYDLPNHLEGQVDVVYTSYGGIGWLPDLDRWAKVIAHFLKPGGRFIMVEFHPMSWMFNDDFKALEFSYFNDGAFVETYNGTYADTNADLQQTDVSWNHNIGAVLSSLLQNGLTLKHFEELPYSPYDCYGSDQIVETAPNQFQIGHLQGKVPMIYSVVATRS